MEFLIKEAEALCLPCFDLVPARTGDLIAGHWGGRRSDLPEEFPEFVIALKSQKHFLSVEQELFDQLGLKARGPLALAMITTAEDDEQLHYAQVSTGKLNEVVFEDSIPLVAKPAISTPPLDAVLLYGGAPVQEWLSAQGLHRWEYSDISTEVAEFYREFVNPRTPLFQEQQPVARIGGWHIGWPDDDFYIPREMRLMVWTFQDSEPWYEVFLSPMRNYVIKSRIT